MIDSLSPLGSTGAPGVSAFPWELAATVAERSGHLPLLDDAGRERGAKRFGRWKRMVPFRGTPQEVEARLSPFGVGAAELTSLLGESRESLRARLGDEPKWSRTFTAAWKAYHAGGSASVTDESGQDGGLPDDLGFLETSRPLLVDARARLMADLDGLAESIAGIPELAALPEILANSLPLAALALSVRRMCVLELNAARVKGQLTGDSPQERFGHFLRLLRDPDYVLALWRAYPVLARYQVEVLDTWRAARVEFARHLLADFPSLVDAMWDGSRPGTLTGVEFGAGDTHRGGRSVVVVRFAERQVVHKPRALLGDVAFNRYLQWLNGGRPPHRMRVPRVVEPVLSLPAASRRSPSPLEAGGCPQTRTIAAPTKYLSSSATREFVRHTDHTHRTPLLPPRGDSEQALAESGHGWVEFVEHEACADVNDVSAFYWRTGALLAMLHSLGASDIHHENVIAAGACPVAVDLEALCHTRLDGPGFEAHSVDPASVALASSVLTVGLLPGPAMVRDEDTNQVHVVDNSGIGSAESISSPVPIPVVEGANTDRMRIVHKHISRAVAANRPRLADGTTLDPLAYGEQVMEGFTFAYERIRRDRAELLRPGGLIDGFGHAPLRIILRPSQTYWRLLEESTHPDFLREALDRDRSLARLCQGLNDNPTRYLLMAAEIRALRSGDIPAFAIRPDSRDIWLDNGDRVADVLPTAPIEALRSRIQRMGREDLAFQQRMIQDSYTSARLSQQSKHSQQQSQQSHQPRRLSATPRPVPPRAVSDEEILECAEKIGERLLGLAIREGERIGWLGLTLLDERHWQLASVGTSLYQGTAGIGMLLTYLAAETSRPLWTDHAQLVARTVAAQLKIVTDTYEPSRAKTLPGHGTGFFGDVAGAVNLLLHAGHVLGDAELLTAVRLALPMLEHQLRYDKAHDVVAGNAGLLLTMLAVHEVLPDTGALRIAQSCAERLLTESVRTGDGQGWLGASGFATAPLAGMSHGAAGISLALARLHRLAGDQRWVAAIEAALRYENTLYNPDLGNWRDLRTLMKDNPFESMCTWCHGAAGIGLARYEMLSCGLPEHLNSTLEADLATALRATWRVMVGSDGYLGVGNHTICHGDLGNAELLTAVSSPWSPSRSDEGVSHGTPAGRPVRPEQVIAAIVADSRQRGWQCGPTGSEVVGLMPGIAGIGYQLLHLIRPSRVPSILRMRPPMVGGTTAAPAGPTAAQTVAQPWRH